MALRRNSILAGALAAAFVSAPALADGIPNNYIYDYMGHGDSITIGLGDSQASNIVIQHPTPWPSYINNTRIHTTGQQGIDALKLMMQNSASGGAAGASGSSGAATTPGVMSSSGATPGAN